MVLYKKKVHCMIQYNGKILLKLKLKGYNTNYIRKNKIMSEKQVQDIRNNKVTMATLNKLCHLLDCQPGDILQYVPDDK